MTLLYNKHMKRLYRANIRLFYKYVNKEYFPWAYTFILKNEITLFDEANLQRNMKRIIPLIKH